MIQDETEIKERHTLKIWLNVADTKFLLVWRWLKRAQAIILLLKLESFCFFEDFKT